MWFPIMNSLFLLLSFLPYCWGMSLGRLFPSSRSRPRGVSFVDSALQAALNRPSLGKTPAHTFKLPAHTYKLSGSSSSYRSPINPYSNAPHKLFSPTSLFFNTFFRKSRPKTEKPFFLKQILKSPFNKVHSPSFSSSSFNSSYMESSKNDANKINKIPAKTKQPTKNPLQTSNKANHQTKDKLSLMERVKESIKKIIKENKNKSNKTKKPTKEPAKESSSISTEKPTIKKKPPIIKTPATSQPFLLGRAPYKSPPLKQHSIPTATSSHKATVVKDKKKIPQKYIINGKVSTATNSPIFYIRLPASPYQYHPSFGYISRPPTPNLSNLLRPQVNFLTNGRPTNIYFPNATPATTSTTTSPPTTTTTTTTPKPTTTTTTTAPTTIKSFFPRPTNSPITWLKGHFLFNGQPNNLFIYNSPYNPNHLNYLHKLYSKPGVYPKDRVVSFQ